MFVFGVWYLSYVIKVFGYLNMFWSFIFWVCFGVFFVLFINKDCFEKKKRKRLEIVEEFLKGVIIFFMNLWVFIGGIIRIINSIGIYGFLVFLLIYMV